MNDPLAAPTAGGERSVLRKTQAKPATATKTQAKPVTAAKTAKPAGVPARAGNRVSKPVVAAAGVAGLVPLCVPERGAPGRATRPGAPRTVRISRRR
ncbi:hypothetical protein [Saccharopolyspora hattusasensis]|uniref:hypothetical protein n=1 Tax=Saccharopolyspora hattusasensis TaxID=1128679 RepID=UPI003D970565